MFKIENNTNAEVMLNEKDLIVKKIVSLSDKQTYTKLKDQFHFLKYMSQALPDIFPKIYECQYDERFFYYSMQYLKKRHENNFFTILDNLEKMYSIKYFDVDDSITFEHYIKRLEGHIKTNLKNELFVSLLRQSYFVVNNQIIENLKLCDFIEMGRYIQKSFNLKNEVCHGDCTLENIVNNQFFDTNFLPNCWNNHLLDLSKLAQSYHYLYEETFKDNFVTKQQGSHIWKFKNFCSLQENSITEHLNEMEIFYFEATHYLRMLKYKTKTVDYIVAYLRMCQCFNEFKKRKNK
jgi:hypothetical protein